MITAAERATEPQQGDGDGRYLPPRQQQQLHEGGEGSYDDNGDGIIWWDCDPTLIIGPFDGEHHDGNSYQDDNDDEILHHRSDDRFITPNDPSSSVCSFTHHTTTSGDMLSTVSPSIFNHKNIDREFVGDVFESGSSSTSSSKGEEGDEFYFDTYNNCEQLQGLERLYQQNEATTTPTYVLEETASNIEAYTTLVGSISCSSHRADGDYDIDASRSGRDDQRLKDVFVNARHDDIDKILTKEMNKLTMQEQLDGCKDVHGVLSSSSSFAASNNGSGSGDSGASSTTTGSTAVNPPPSSSWLPSKEMEEKKIMEIMVELLASSSSSTTTGIPTGGNGAANSSKSNSNYREDSNNRKKNDNNEVDAYDMAVSMDANYVHDPKFLLMFLRADNYSIPKAIWRIKHHFRIKLELFGKEMLVLTCHPHIPKIV